MYHFICSNPECAFTKKASESAGIEKFCPECGDELIYKCPECGMALRNEGARFCSLCRAEIKKQPIEGSHPA